MILPLQLEVPQPVGCRDAQRSDYTTWSFQRVYTSIKDHRKVMAQGHSINLTLGQKTLETYQVGSHISKEWGIKSTKSSHSRAQMKEQIQKSEFLQLV